MLDVATVNYKVEVWGDWKYIRTLEVNRLNARLRRYVGREMGRAAKVTAREIQKTIRRMRPRNARLTILIKGKNSPLRDTGRLLGDVRPHQQFWDEAFAGILRGDPSFAEAARQHDGDLIPVTPAMRGMFRLLFMVSEGRTDPSLLYGRAAQLYAAFPGPWYELKPTTTVIRIPPRPFVDATLARQDWQMKVLVRLREAVRKAFDVKRHRS